MMQGLLVVGPNAAPNPLLLIREGCLGVLLFVLVFYCTLLETFLLTSVGLDTHLFVKVPRSGESEGNFSVFESTCHLLLPV